MLSLKIIFWPLAVTLPRFVSRKIFSVKLNVTFSKPMYDSFSRARMFGSNSAALPSWLHKLRSRDCKFGQLFKSDLAPLRSTLFLTNSSDLRLVLDIFGLYEHQLMFKRDNSFKFDRTLKPLSVKPSHVTMLKLTKLGHFCEISTRLASEFTINCWHLTLWHRTCQFVSVNVQFS